MLSAVSQATLHGAYSTEELTDAKPGNLRMKTQSWTIANTVRQKNGEGSIVENNGGGELASP